MRLADPVLPAATHLTGSGAVDVLRPAVTAAGGVLHTARCASVHYLPGRELVARYDCDISWPAGRVRDTLLAGTTSQGHLSGAVPVHAETPAGQLAADVWRWPFDPVLTGLPIATTPALLSDHLRHVTGPGEVSAKVVAYRPAQRAVIRVTTARGQQAYLKALPPGEVRSVVARHEALLRAGVRAPKVLTADESTGLVLMEAMAGATLRDRIKAGDPAWPRPDHLAQLLERVADAGAYRIDGSPVPGRSSRLHDAAAHAQLLATILPDAAELIDDVEQRTLAWTDGVAQRYGPVIHGDLHESQLFVNDDGVITGLIDLDDLGPGDPLDDPAVLLGHLEYRAITGDPSTAAVLNERMAALRHHFATIHGSEPLAAAVGAVLVGLATGPFRSQSPRWRHTTLDVLGAAARRLTGDDRP